MPPPHHPNTLPAGGLAFLADMADAKLEAALAVDDRPAAWLLRVRALAEEVELGWLPLPDGRHPVDELLGLAAPADWEALGVAATGTARHLDSPGASVRVRTVHLVARDGAWASRWAPFDLGADAGCADAGVGDEPGRPVGRIDDACRRALGLPTPEPPAATGLLWALRWLDAVVTDATSRCRRRGSPTWPEVAALHPAVTALRGDAGDEPPAPQALGGLARQLEAWRDWAVVRKACATGASTEPEVDAEVAAWLDDGAFARWTLGAYPELDDLRAAAAAILPGRVARAIEATLAAAGVTAP